MAQQEEKPGATGHYEKRVCNVCSLEPECISWDLRQADYGNLDRIVEHPPVLDEGNHLFRTGDDFSAVYAVRTGAFKTYAFDSGGHEYVLGFAFAGELIGFDGVYSRRHGCNAVAVQESAVCALPYYELASLMEKVSTLRNQVLRLASQSFGDRIVNSSLAPEARIARFLLDMSRRTRNGDASEPLELPMSPCDIANYLSVTIQHVNSLFTHFMREDIIFSNDSRLKILDPDRLNQIAQQKGRE